MRLLETAIRLDHFTFGWCQQRRGLRLLIVASRQVSRSADGYLYALLGLIALLAEYYLFLLVALTAIGLERFFYFVLKNSIRRDRPPEAIPGFRSIIKAADQFSCPSGHTSAAFLVAALLFQQFPSTAYFIYLWAFSVAMSRVMLGVHFPFDTLVGAALGSCIGFASPILVENFL